MFVGAHLSAPDPERLSKQHFAGVIDLWNLEVGALDGAAGRMIGGRHARQVVRFVRLPIGILAKKALRHRL